MKLKAFNSETCIVKRNNKPYIGLDTKTGLFRINRELCEKIGLKAGMKISFHQDEKEPEDWYLLMNDPKGFAVREKASIINGVTFNNATLARKISDSVEFTGRSGQILLGKEPVVLDKSNYWPLITTALNKSK